jgi:hypothetical protein
VATVSHRYLEVPRNPQRAYEFLRVVPRTIQPKGVTRRNLLYMGARKLGFQEHGFVDEFALRELLKRWNLSMGVSPVERRIALRMSRQEQASMTAVATQ